MRAALNRRRTSSTRRVAHPLVFRDFAVKRRSTRSPGGCMPRSPAGPLWHARADPPLARTATRSPQRSEHDEGVVPCESASPSLPTERPMPLLQLFRCMACNPGHAPARKISRRACAVSVLRVIPRPILPDAIAVPLPVAGLARNARPPHARAPAPEPLAPGRHAWPPDGACPTRSHAACGSDAPALRHCRVDESSTPPDITSPLAPA